MTQPNTADYKCFLQNRANKTKHHSSAGKTYIYYIQKSEPKPIQPAELYLHTMTSFRPPSKLRPYVLYTPSIAVPPQSAHFPLRFSCLSRIAPRPAMSPQPRASRSGRTRCWRFGCRSGAPVYILQLKRLSHAGPTPTGSASASPPARRRRKNRHKTSAGLTRAGAASTSCAGAPGRPQCAARPIAPSAAAAPHSSASLRRIACPKRTTIALLRRAPASVHPDSLKIAAAAPGHCSAGCWPCRADERSRTEGLDATNGRLWGGGQLGTARVALRTPVGGERVVCLAMTTAVTLRSCVCTCQLLNEQRMTSL